MIELLDKDLKPLARLENATNVTMKETLNQPGECLVTFQLPFNDPKLKECYAFRYIQITDKNKVEYYDPYRIMPRKIEHSPQGLATIECEHAITTLVDDLLNGYHEVGNLGYYTKEVIQYILNRQTVQNWVLGECEFAHQFQYGWEDENLLQALYSVPNCFSDDYRFTFETQTYPWTLNLVKLDKTAQPISRFRYGYNVNSVRKEEDTSELCNKLYCRGYGEGVNQLTIASVNNGLDYIENLESQSKYGVITRAWTDRRFEYADALLARGEKLLEGYSKPRLSYSLDVVDLFPLTNNEIDRPRIGDVTRVEDHELDEDFTSVIVSVNRRDIFGNKPSTQIEVENTKADLASTISEQADKLHVEQSYAQGATNIWAQSFADNADATHPAEVSFYIPSDTRQVNLVNVRWQAGAFRAYSKANESSTASTQSSSSGGGGSTTSSSGGGTYSSTGASSLSTTQSAYVPSIFANPTSTPYHPSGTITLETHMHALNDFADGSMKNAIQGHTHSIEHTHDFSVDAHTHTVTVPTHTHTVTIPAHTHGITYGIYEGTRATSAVITVDGAQVEINQNEDFDITPYLSKDDGGKIKRGTSHTIKITPNTLTRITLTVTPQVFIQSRGGGNY